MQQQYKDSFLTQDEINFLKDSKNIEFNGSRSILRLGMRSSKEAEYLKNAFLSMAKIPTGRQQLREIIADIKSEHARGNTSYKYRFYAQSTARNLSIGGQDMGAYNGYSKDITVSINGISTNTLGANMLHESLHQRQDKNNNFKRRLASNDTNTISTTFLLSDAETIALSLQLATELNDTEQINRLHGEGYQKLYQQNLKKYQNPILASYNTRKTFVCDFIKPLDEKVNLDYGSLDLRIEYAFKGLVGVKQLVNTRKKNDPTPGREFKQGLHSRFPDIPLSEFDKFETSDYWREMINLANNPKITKKYLLKACNYFSNKANLDISPLSTDRALGKVKTPKQEKAAKNKIKKFEQNSGIKIHATNIHGQKIVQNETSTENISPCLLNQFHQCGEQLPNEQTDPTLFPIHDAHASIV